MIQRNLAGIILTLGVLVLTGCSISKIQSAQGRRPGHSVKAIAMAPSGGLLADAIGVELFNLGYQVFDTSQTSSLLVRLNLSEMEVVRPENLTRLRAEGIDAYLVCRAAAGSDGLPQSASVRVNSTHTGAILAGLSWQNGWGGQAGSIADRTMRKDLSEAASEIAHELSTRLRSASP